MARRAALGAMIDPAAQSRDLGFGQRFGVGRHPILGARHGRDQQALVALARDDHRSAIGPLANQVPRIEPQTGFLPQRTVAHRAMTQKQRSHVACIVDRRCDRPLFVAPAHGRPGSQQQTSDKEPAAVHTYVRAIAVGNRPASADPDGELRSAGLGREQPPTCRFRKGASSRRSLAFGFSRREARSHENRGPDTAWPRVPSALRGKHLPAVRSLPHIEPKEGEARAP